VLSFTQVPRLKTSTTPFCHTFIMNRVFYAEEPVRQIALSADMGPTGSASLLAFACCCKTLEGPVMDILWLRQKYLPAILQTLPADCWAFTDEKYVSGSHLNPSSHLLISSHSAPHQRTQITRLETIEDIHRTCGRTVRWEWGGVIRDNLLARNAVDDS
jgi:hypothetical protein